MLFSICSDLTVSKRYRILQPNTVEIHFSVLQSTRRCPGDADDFLSLIFFYVMKLIASQPSCLIKQTIILPES